MAGYALSTLLRGGGASFSLKNDNLRKFAGVIFFISCALSITLSGYVSMFNNVHHMELAKFLHKDIRSHELLAGNYSDYNILYLSDCYYFPAYSIIHKNINIRILNCAPDLRLVKYLAVYLFLIRF